MRKIRAAVLAVSLLMCAGTPPVKAQLLGLESLALQLIMPALSSVMNTVQSVSFSLSDFAAIFADADMFIEKNAEKIAFDIAKGEGEYLDALGDLLEVPAALRPAWHKEMQQRYAAATKKG